MEIYKKLSELWPNKGFVEIPDDWQSAFFQALVSPPNARPRAADRDKFDVQEAWKAKCLQWMQEGEIDAEDVTWERVGALSNVLVHTWGRHKLTVDDVAVNVEQTPPFRILNSQPIFSWAWHGWARGWFWALIYHLGNSQMRNPEATWTAVLRGARAYHALIPVQRRRQWEDEELCMYLALYERLLGLKRGIAKRPPHYIRNIVERGGLSREDRGYRARYFSQLVDALLRKVLGKLGSCEEA